jgi:NAD(P)-dependent dehydrogenase (short-subunit alcohol dehydrogenase family)
MKLAPGQVAVVTGAASGIGLALAKAFVGRGLAVGLSDVEEGTLHGIVDGLAGAGARVIALPCDVSSPEAVDATRDAALSAFGRVDIVCNNAGIMLPFKPIWEATLADWRWMCDVNLTGVFNGIRSFAPLMVAQGSGAIVNTASMAGVSVIAGNGPYNAAKHAVVSLTETLQADFDAAGVAAQAMVICCGLVNTRIREAGRNRPGGATAAILGRSLDGALEPEEIAALSLRGIEEKRLYLFTNPGTERMVHNRLARLQSDLALL